MDKTTIESGKFLDSVLNFFSKMWDNLTENNYLAKNKGPETQEIKYKDGESGEELTSGLLTTYYLKNNHVMRTKTVFSKPVSEVTEDNQFPCELYIIMDSGQKYRYEGSQAPKDSKNLMNLIESSLVDAYPDDFKPSNISEEEANNLFEPEETSASRKIQVELSKIQASNEVILGPIYCNYDEFEVYEDLENVLDSDEFIDDLTEAPQLFEIIPSEEAYDIEPIGEIEPMNYASQVIRSQFIALMQLYSTKWNGDCLLDKDPMSYIQLIRWQLDWMISSPLSALDVDIAEILKSIQPEEIEPNGDVSNIVENYCIVLDLYYSNFSHEVQKLLDDWLLTLRYC